MEKICKNCFYWKQDYGVFTATGWTGRDRDDGYCHFERFTVFKRGIDYCSHFKTEE